MSSPFGAGSFGKAFDLSSLRKPTEETLTSNENIEVGVEATVENLPRDLMPLSNTKPVIIVCWSTRFPESRTVLQSMAKLNQEDNGAWQLAKVEIEKQPQVAQALRSEEHTSELQSH